jgi:hypothetical protein
MSKHFGTFPPEFEQYDPEKVLIGGSKIKQTFDENGKLHSFNDVPSFMGKKKGFHTSSYSFEWHFHGELFRENGNPPRIEFSNNSYTTYDENRTIHSYNDQPAMIESYSNGNTLLSWGSHGLVHRENDLPAVIKVSIPEINEGVKTYSVENIYKFNSLQHRGHGLPAVEREGSSVWMVHGVHHNAQGRAIFHKALEASNFRTQDWGLYGFRMLKTHFSKIKKLETSKQIPLWVAVLLFFDFINEENLNLFKTKDNLWDSNIPVEWVLRAWGLTNETFTAKKKALASSRTYARFDNKTYHNMTKESDLQVFLKIVKAEEADTLKPVLTLEI